MVNLYKFYIVPFLKCHIILTVSFLLEILVIAFYITFKVFNIFVIAFICHFNIYNAFLWFWSFFVIVDLHLCPLQSKS